MRAAVIDVGSNSIKILVAERGADGALVEVLSRTLEVRISKGIGSGRPSLTQEGIRAGVAAIAALAAEAGGAGRVTVVATSAVRDASNGSVFGRELASATGLDLRILTGSEEATLIGRGLTTDPALAGLRNFHSYDLGGGSLECLSFEDRKLASAVSLPLGCVRLTEMFVPSPGAPLGPAERAAISKQVKDSLDASGFPVVPAGWAVVGTGGTLTTIRAMAAATRGISVHEADPLVPESSLRDMLSAVGSVDLAARKNLKGLPPARADVFPTALATLLALAESAGIQAFHHSFRNLRWGVAAEILE